MSELARKLIEACGGCSYPDDIERIDSILRAERAKPTQGDAGSLAKVLIDEMHATTVELREIVDTFQRRNERAKLEAAAQHVVDDIHDYERVNNLAPNPGRTECWQSVSDLKAALASIRAEGSAEREKLEDRIRQHRGQISRLQDTVMKLKGDTPEAPAQPSESGATSIGDDEGFIVGVNCGQDDEGAHPAESGATERICECRDWYVCDVCAGAKP